MKCFIRSESCAELARLWGVMMMTMMRLNIMCSDYNDMDMDVRWCCAKLRCNVSCDMMWCAVRCWMMHHICHLFMDFHKYNIASANERERCVFFCCCCRLLVIKHYTFKPFCRGKFKFVMPLNVHLFILYGHIIVCVCMYSWWLIQFALLIGSHVWFFGLFFAYFLSFFLSFSRAFFLPFHFAVLGVIILCSTIENMIKVKQHHNHFSTIFEAIASG